MWAKSFGLMLIGRFKLSFSKDDTSSYQDEFMRIAQGRYDEIGTNNGP